MFAMIFSGIWALTQINTQFLPDFNINKITVIVPWPGASAEDVAQSITIPLEQELRSVDYLKKIDSSSQIGSSTIVLEFYEETEMGRALEQVKDRIDLVRDLPTDSEEPQVNREENFEPIANVLITGAKQLQELRPLAYRIEQDLLDRGIAKVNIIGLPELMVAVQIPSLRIAELQLSFTRIAQKIAQLSQDLPAGTLGRGSVGQQLRSLNQGRTVSDFEQMPLVSDINGRLLLLKDVADVELLNQDDEVIVEYKEQPAIKLELFRTRSIDALTSAKVLQKYGKEISASLPENIQFHAYYQSWKHIQERINLLLRNGLSGLLLILGLLFLFLNQRIAFWVAMGIPVSFLAAITVLYLLGGTINMVSLFAMIMSLGVIVDDTIVVGEESLTLLSQGEPADKAVEMGAKRMLAPVMASSLTTICAFTPLLLIGDTIGAILADIPRVVICIILASVVECFLILPGHLRQSYRRIKKLHNHPMREKIDKYFNHFREEIFRPFVSYAITHRALTLSIAFAGVIFVIGLLQGGWVRFTFFPSPDGTQIQAFAEFSAGTSETIRADFLKQMEAALWETEAELATEKSLVETAVAVKNHGGMMKGKGSNFVSMDVELIGPDDREIQNQTFIEQWKENIKLIPEVTELIISAPKAGPPGQDIDIELTGAEPHSLKKASLAIQEQLRQYVGISSVEDNLPFGQQQIIYDLNAQGRAVGLTVDGVGRQLRAAFTGELVEVFHRPNEEIEVRVMLPNEERFDSTILEQLPIVTPSGDVVPLDSIVTLDFHRGFDILRRTGTRLGLHIYGEVDPKKANANEIRRALQQTTLPQIAEQYNVHYQFAGKAEEQADTLHDMVYGVMLAMIMIYIILAWVFSSYIWPFAVMIAIPLGLVGAVIGHWVMGFDLTILSLFGFFGLSGIVINDSIILITAYKNLKEQGAPSRQAIVDASCQRLRAVLLTSITTIAGLTPLLFERSLQAQFLIPMAISITFGLAFGTGLILVVVPALLSIYEDYRMQRTAQMVNDQ